MWHVLPMRGQLTEQVPGTLTGLVMARFDRLPESSAQDGTESGGPGSDVPSRSVWSLSRTRVPIDVMEQIEVLVQRQFLVPEALEYQRGYTFRHALIQEAVYGTLLKRDRQRFHGQVAEAIERSAIRAAWRTQ